MKKTTWSWILFILGLCVLAGTFVLSAYAVYPENVTSVILVFAMILIVISLLNILKKGDERKHDEMTRNIARHAAGFSWVVTLLSLIAIYWLHMFEIVTFSVNGVIWTTYAIMVATMVFYQQFQLHNGPRQ